MRVRIRILYKSGATQTVRAKKFECRWSDEDGNLTGVSWDDLSPRPLHLGINEIAAVFHLRWWQGWWQR